MDLSEFFRSVLSGIIVFVIIAFYNIIKRHPFWGRVRLNSALLQTVCSRRLTAYKKLLSYLNPAFTKALHWSDENNDNIVIVERFGSRQPVVKFEKEHLVLDIPENHKKIIETYYLDFDNSTLEDSMMPEARTLLKKEYSVFYGQTEQIDDKTINDIITRHRTKVADTFIKRLESSKICFNNTMYGLYDYRIIRSFKIGNKEFGPKVGLELRFYETDFFTFQVFQSIFDELSTNPKCGINNIKDGNDLRNYRVFLCSFGVNTFVITDAKYYSEILFAKRSKYNIGAGVYKNRYHYSMNEAFSKTDERTKHDTIKPFEKCIKKGLNEELGIPGINKPKGTFFLDFNFSKQLMQVGLNSICYFDDISSNEIRTLYYSSKDGPLETDDLVFVPYKKKKLKPLVFNNSITKVRQPKYHNSVHIDSLTDECRLGLHQMLARYPKVSYLKNSIFWHLKSNASVN